VHLVPNFRNIRLNKFVQNWLHRNLFKHSIAHSILVDNYPSCEGLNHYSTTWPHFSNAISKALFKLPSELVEGPTIKCHKLNSIRLSFGVYNSIICLVFNYKTNKKVALVHPFAIQLSCRQYNL